ncbi:diacylglycerol/lipid kinase family protein [Sporohalobacter salinus]|uniref:diacylglycerol/lipid kinase family protein n=1 Tax=Sporohalobacter salinus TaxID=1494606 RepID=UPI001961E12F|nr:YegS/Rv2252/BmrU family lipid kinase [Sporohalobacter salinus]MBM7624824.1 YegS/Rv2252/BmrU family lipid kinase [Sporohalobacter salinus]
MKLLKLIYNPVSGNKNFSKALDYCIDKLQSLGYLVNLYRTERNQKLTKAFFDIEKLDYDAIITAGGDGTINKVINQIQRYDLDIPLGIIPTGTANDLAAHLNIPYNLDGALDIIAKDNLKAIDLGKITGDEENFFVNVCAGGMFANVAHQTDRKFKNTFGKLAYYLNGLAEVSTFEAVSLKITTSKTVIEEEVLLFLIFNGSSAGGFNNLGKSAEIDDGLLDLVAIKNVSFNKLPALLLKILQGNHIKDENIIHCKSNYMKLEMLDNNIDNFKIDVDGEVGPLLPIEVSICFNELKIFVP